MRMTFRWFGPGHDPIPLDHIRQIPGVTGVVSSLADAAPGEVWEPDAVRHLRQTVEAAGLRLQVIESVNIHEDIKTGDGRRDQYIDAWIRTLRVLAAEGIEVVCYNFMPVIDWYRTDLHWPLPDGSTAMYYHAPTVEALSPATLAQRIYDGAGIFSMPGWEPERIRALGTLFERYASVDQEQLFANLRYFLEAVVPVARELGIRLALHPDDPPRPIFGLPRIVHKPEHLRRIAAMAPAPAHGFALCSGSLGADPANDIAALVREWVPQDRVPFAHVRNIRFTGEGSFTETSHRTADGSLDIRGIMQAYHDTGFKGFMRPDHGRMIWNEEGRPGYGLYDRALGIMYLLGLWEAMEGARHGS
jgi:mannonate dehydratase